MSENEYTISQVSKITGVSTSAINYYVRLNIIEPPKKTAKTRSSFSNLHIEKINEIKKLQNNGFPLKLIKKKLNSISTELKEFFSVEEIIEISEVSKIFYEDLIKLQLIKKPKTIDGEKVHPANLVKIIRSYKVLLDSGVSYETIKRHEEYKKLSEAEAYFLLEHLNDAKRNKSNFNQFEIVEAFENIRSFYRMDFFNE